MNLSLRYPALLVIALAFLTGSCKKRSESASTVGADSVANSELTPIFDGTSMTGWDGDPAVWRVEDGSLVGEVKPGMELKTNTFLTWTGGTPSDFELMLEFRITESGNSGVNYRSEKVEAVPYALRGYQADIDGKINYTGQNYEERGRTTLAYRGEVTNIHTQDNPADPESFRAAIQNNAWLKRDITGSLGTSDSLKSLVKPQDWNTCRIVAKGNHLQHYINGVLMSDVTDEDEANRKSSGLLGFQVHVGPPMKVEYRNVRLRKL